MKPNLNIIDGTTFFGQETINIISDSGAIYKIYPICIFNINPTINRRGWKIVGMPATPAALFILNEQGETIHGEGVFTAVQEWVTKYYDITSLGQLEFVEVFIHPNTMERFYVQEYTYTLLELALYKEQFLNK